MKESYRDKDLRLGETDGTSLPRCQTVAKQNRVTLRRTWYVVKSIGLLSYGKQPSYKNLSGPSVQTKRNIGSMLDIICKIIFQGLLKIFHHDSVGLP